MMKQDILNNLEAFATKRPGLMFADYGDVTLYRQDYREHCEKPLRDFRALLRAVRFRDGIDAGDLIQSIRETNRLDMMDDGTLDYTPGQMGATEFRHAACNALSRALWSYWWGYSQGSMTPRDFITSRALREFGRGITARYFN